MSDVNKPEKTSANQNCFINPDQYKNHDAVAPVGSYPWAIIQLYLGNLMYRNDWDYPNEYIGLVPKSEKIEDDKLDYLIKKRKHNSFDIWQPTQEDMMACDWGQIDYMLSFDLEIEESTYEGGQDWGYLADDEFEGLNERTFGTLTRIQNKTDIEKISLFYWEERVNNTKGLWWKVSSENSKEGYQKMIELFNKNLSITVDGITYNLGNTSPHALKNKGEYEYAGAYFNAEAQELSAILKQAGQTKRFYCNWR
ncbi:DUF2829 domain-containing protein [Xenorhabdus bovienii]|uniref:DUF2829 domain-containing protein n=1 Tax=Xenorhabdus bovienii TaxID=40576 RepID=UPI0023B2E6B4|nr:DUF2829 domain-containing protein [Xenorhabdus bovienii]MDE9484153.1 DUF2829 domain-containing protein [Xenorhabdus bovienii]MDE9565745.1 DUF2829 domain-containing protein [Xenorhabdus bovienii]